MRILVWHVHAAWTTAFVHGPHDYVVPVLPDRGPDGRGRAQTYEWPAAVRELEPEALATEPFDVVVLQRPHELELVEHWLGRRPGDEVPAVFVEHNSPQGRIADMRHPLADRDDLLIAHVTHFNALFWDCGGTATTVIEHGVVDPGALYSGVLPRAAIVVNEARRRGRVTGTDLFAPICGGVPWDLFGIDSDSLGGVGDLPYADLHRAMARRRLYVHPNRWTSLGLSLVEAMHLGMPVVAVATTEAHDAVPADAGVVSNRLDVLRAAVERLARDPDEAAERGALLRAHALQRYGLRRFLDDWDEVLAAVTTGGRRGVLA
jgi:glycosyltransferase involved in cell wall biosynthesis